MVQPTIAKRKYISTSDSTTQRLLDENTYWIIYVCRNMFILFVDDHRITLYDIYLEYYFSFFEKKTQCYLIFFCVALLDDAYCCYSKSLNGKSGFMEVAKRCIRYYK